MQLQIIHRTDDTIAKITAVTFDSGAQIEFTASFRIVGLVPTNLISPAQANSDVSNALSIFLSTLGAEIECGPCDLTDYPLIG